MRILTILLVLVTSVLHAQECNLLVPNDVKVMGLSRSDVTLSEVDTVVVPIVFHVVHTGAGEENNISDEQVLSQFDVLNEEFADSKIQFCMASRDPEGEPTSGITRYDYSWNEEYVLNGVTNGTINSSGVDQEEMKQLAGCWNPDEYINYYVVSEINGNDGGNGVQGFAYLGPTYDCRDGVVVLYNATGNVGTLKQGRELGFTGVHEVGHHLSLYHTFDNSNDCEETNCENQGDRVCDTPPTTANQYGCFGEDCPDALVENFMDYTPETCKDSFTVGQAERMHEQLQGVRSGLVDNLSCVPVVDYDATPLTAYYQQTWCTPNQDIWIDVVNQGVLPMDVVEVQLYCNGSQYTEFLYDVATGTHEVLFEQVYVEGAQQFEVQVISSLDQFADNDYAWWPIETVVGELLNISVETDMWANETDWVLYDGSGEVVLGDNGYPFGINTYEYEVCVFDGCYTVEITDYNDDGFCSIDLDGDGVCDIGGDGITGTIGLDTLFATGFGAQFSVWDSTFCIEVDPCPLDFDGNGAVGNGDILEMMLEYGCDGDCVTDPDGDGNVDVMDLLYILTNLGECPLEQDFSQGMVKDLVVANSEPAVFGVSPRIYDMTGREVRGPVENLAAGIYILKWKNVTKKVFVQ
jgi:hypothetical protein